MCGIAGFVNTEDFDLMPEILNSMRHRGPDDQGIYRSHDVCLGMIRLAIIDIEGGSQPVFNEDGTIAAVFNGEIYNYQELRSELKLKGHSFKSQGDSEVIVHAYEEWGSGFMHHLNGMFSIALWNSNNREFFLIRDRFGIKPIFYRLEGEECVFSSELKGIRLYGKKTNKLNLEAIGAFLNLRYIPAPLTVYEEVSALLPGEFLHFQNNKWSKNRWYQLPTKSSSEYRSEKKLVDELDRLLTDSVRIRMRTDVEFGAYLSGGIDSSLLVAIMSRLTDKPIQTFSLGYQDSPAHKKDLYFADLVAKKYKTIHREYIMSANDFKGEVAKVLSHLDQPFAGVLSSYWLSRYMKQFVTVAISGDGADELFGSYGHHRLIWPIKKIRDSENYVDLKDDDYGYFSDKKSWIHEMSLLDPWEWRLNYCAFNTVELNRLLTEKGKGCFHPGHAVDWLKQAYNQTDRCEDDLNKMLALDIQTLLPNEILYFNDMLSMAHSMEVRTPFLDYRVVEFACSIPGESKIKHKTLKYILRKLAERYLPREIIDRPKEGFVLPKNSWLRSEARHLIDEELSKDMIIGQGLFCWEYIEHLIKQFKNGDDAVTFKLWSLVVFQLWSRENGVLRR